MSKRSPALLVLITLIFALLTDAGSAGMRASSELGHLQAHADVLLHHHHHDRSLHVDAPGDKVNHVHAGDGGQPAGALPATGALLSPPPAPSYVTAPAIRPPEVVLSPPREPPRRA